MFGQKNIIIIGGNAAGPAAAAKAKRVSPDSRVIMFEAGEFISTGTCELPYLLGGGIKDYKDIVFFSSESFHDEKDVEVYTSHRVEQIDRRGRRILVSNLNDGNTYQFDYDKLILTTGSVAKKIHVLQWDYKNVFHLKSVSDYLKIKDYFDTNNVKRVLIVGAGYIGLESAEAFKNLGFDVTIVEKAELPMPGLDTEIRQLILDELVKNDVEFYGDVEDLKFNSCEDKITSIKLDGRTIEYDLILVAAGVEPNNDLAVTSGLNTGDYNGLLTDRKQKTNDPNIYAAGDNVEVINKVTGRPDYFPIATIAYRQGHVAGENAAGGNEFFDPVVRNIAVKIFDKTFVSVGLSMHEAQQVQFNIKSVTGTAKNLVHVMPGSQKVLGKIIYDASSKYIMGASFFGSKEVVGYGDMIASFIHNKIDAGKLAGMDFNYTPPASPFINLLSVLGKKIQKDN